MMSVTGNSVTGGSGDDVTSGKLSAQTISESVDWTPYKQFYLHGDVSLVYSYLQTAYPVVVVTTASPAVASPIQNANNNYITGSVLAGFVLSKQADGQIQGIYTRANDYNPADRAGRPALRGRLRGAKRHGGPEVQVHGPPVCRRQGGLPAPDGRHDRRVHQLQGPARLRRPDLLPLTRRSFHRGPRPRAD